MKQHCETGIDFPLPEYDWSNWCEIIEDSYKEKRNEGNIQRTDKNC